MKEEPIALTPQEREMVQAVADQQGISVEEAASKLFSEGMEARYRRRTGKGPANNVRRFRGR